MKSAHDFSNPWVLGIAVLCGLLVALVGRLGDGLTSSASRLAGSF